MKTIFCSLLSVGLLTGCMMSMAAGGPVAKVHAKSCLVPVVDAIEAFKQQHRRIPASLEELQAAQKKPLKLAEETDAGRRWRIYYKTKGGSYTVTFAHVHYHLEYTDGKETHWSYNPFA